jgi:hypothetical protein
VLAASLAIDGAVLRLTLRELSARARQQFPEAWAPGAGGGLRARARALLAHLRSSPDPFLTAVALEDGAACAGVVLAAAGVGGAQLLGAPALDGAASVAIGAMLAAVAVALVRLNMRYLLGVSVGRAATERIGAAIRAFPSIDAVRHVHTQVLSPTTFLLSAKVDFDGTYLAAQLHRDVCNASATCPAFEAALARACAGDCMRPAPSAGRC